MPTKVLDLEFDAIPEAITGLEAYDRAMVLVRIGGRPVERVYVPVEAGKIIRDNLRSAIVRNAGRVFWEYFLREIIACPAEDAWVGQPPEATVAICTRDRPNDLLRCLEALTHICNEQQEILVIDSCSSRPDTYEVVQKFPTIRYVREEKPGLNRARNRALLEAHNEIIAFIDDDTVPVAGWLDAIRRNFCHANALCVTGLTMPLELETEAQEAFENYTPFGRGFVHKIFRWNNLNLLSSGLVGAGANMALRRSVLELVGPFDIALDGGTPALSGGDSEMFARILAAGYWIVYEPAALIWHRHRRSWKELRKTMYGYGAGWYAWWARKLLFEGGLSVVPIALYWFLVGQLPLAVRSLFRRENAPSFDLILLEILGCISGPWLYLKSRRINPQ